MSIYKSFGEGCFDCLDESYVTEWRVDSDAKEEIIKDAAKNFQNMINKNKALSNSIRIMQPEKISRYNLNIWDKWTHKNNYTNKRRTIMIGAYNFDKKIGANFDDLKDMIEDFNDKYTDIKLTVANTKEDTMEAIFYNLCYSGYGQAMTYSSIQKRGVINLTIKKKAIKEFADDSDF